jgi:Cu-Zn family superoxide dismutase
MRKFVLTAATAAALAGCVYREPEGGAPMPLIDSSGRQVGTVVAWDSPGGVGLRIQASGLPHGIHGLHVHETGICAGPDFKSAGGHWNPASRQHGLVNPQGPHAGDLPNVVVSANGNLTATATISGASLSPGSALLDADGAALVIHAGPDDNKTDPSGNSGARIACTVLQPTTARY